MKKPDYPVFLFIAYIIIFTFLGINPHNRLHWMLDNCLSVLFVFVLIWTYFKFRLSNISYTMIFCFLVIQAIGVHYAYVFVPLGDWLSLLLGSERNPYDRIVHFSFGLLFAYPLREVLIKLANPKRFWSYWFPVELILALSALYEMGEWIVGITVFQELGDMFLGLQGDMWDAQKDMVLAFMGSMITMILTWLIHTKNTPPNTNKITKKHKSKTSKPRGKAKFGK